MTFLEAYPDCGCCHGTGETYDWVPYGDTNVRLYSACECCIDRAIADGIITEDTEKLELRAAR